MSLSACIVYHVEVYPTGSERWYLDGLKHRIGGPAITYSDGSKVWCQYDKTHRVDGPAIENADGSKHWFLEGIRMTEEEHAERTSKSQELTVADIEQLLGYKVKIVK